MKCVLLRFKTYPAAVTLISAATVMTLVILGKSRTSQQYHTSSCNALNKSRPFYLGLEPFVSEMILLGARICDLRSMALRTRCGSAPSGRLGVSHHLRTGHSINDLCSYSRKDCMYLHHNLKFLPPAQREITPSVRLQKRVRIRIRSPARHHPAHSIRRSE